MVKKADSAVPVTEEGHPTFKDQSIDLSSDSLDTIKNLDKTNMKKLTPEDAQKIGNALKEAWELLSPEQKEFQQRKALVQQKKAEELDKFIDELIKQEVFQIPLRGKDGKSYQFIGYDTDQYQELNRLGREADAIDITERDQDKYLKLEIDVFRKMIKYSLDGIADEDIAKIPYRDLALLHRVFKIKNEQPLPFDLKR